MPDQPQERRSWVKLWTHEYIHGSTRRELLPDERSLWTDFLAMAGDSPKVGFICLAENIGYTDDQLCGILCVDIDLLHRAKDKMMSAGKISCNGNNIIEIVNFWKYQSTFDRNTYQRNYMKNKRKQDKLDKQVSLTSKTDKLDKLVRPDDKINHKIREDIDIDNNITINKEGGGDKKNGNTQEIGKDINSNSNVENNKSFSCYKTELKNNNNKIAVLVDAFKIWHQDAPAEDIEHDFLYGYIGKMTKRLNNDYGYLLKIIWDTVTSSIAGSHLNYINSVVSSIIKKRESDRRKTVVKTGKKLKTLADIEESEK